MKVPPKPKLRTNPFLTYRDPETGYWVTIIPKAQDQLDPTVQRPPQVFRVVEPEDFQQMAVQAV